MTHRSVFDIPKISWSDCLIERLNSSNGFLLRHISTRQNLFFLSGDDLGLLAKDNSSEAYRRAREIFKLLVHTHNQAHQKGQTNGFETHREGVLNALGIANLGGG